MAVVEEQSRLSDVIEFVTARQLRKNYIPYRKDVKEFESPSCWRRFTCQNSVLGSSRGDITRKLSVFN